MSLLSVGTYARKNELWYEGFVPSIVIAEINGKEVVTDPFTLH
jgi:hypothetical protein